MEHMRAEADAAHKEKEEERNRRAANPTPRAKRATATSKAAGKVRLVWSVRNQRGDEVSFYPYPQEAEARAEAERLADESERAHFVTKAEKPAE
jgi:hypothetical protein